MPSGRVARPWLVLALLAAGAAAATAALGSDEAEACTARGGLWFGELGCETERPRIDRIAVDKSERLLIAYEGKREVRRFLVALGREPVGDKVREGDGRTPEGSYPITFHNPRSQFHLSLRLGYPTSTQAAAARAAGIDPGGDIMIHGLPNATPWLGAAHRARDWTLGCIALTNDEIEWLYRFTPVGAVVEISA